MMNTVFRIPLVLTPHGDGGYTVTSPLIPELVTEGESLDAALANVKDALAAVRELYEDTGRQIPGNVIQSDIGGPIWTEQLVSAA